MLNTKSAISLLIGLGFYSSSWALNLELKGDYSLQQQTYAKSAMHAVMQALPEEIKNTLSHNIDINFAELNTNSTDRHRLGIAYTQKKRIVLNQKFLKEKTTSIHFNELALKKTLAHEIAHFYDFKNFDSQEIAQLKQNCEADKSAENNISQLCHSLENKQTRISQDPEFMALTGWVNSGLQAKQLNEFKRRLTNPYVDSQLTESFPTYFEAYLFEEDFACRLPHINDYFNKAFQVAKQKNCDKNLSFYFSSEEPHFRTIAINQIWAIDYLWASEGKSPASRFGHSMLRLVVCKEGRAPGPDCYKDLSQHIVLSFAASSEVPSFSNIEGMTGKYPLNLYAMSFNKAKVQYNLMELRDLYALPLKLTEAQKEQTIFALNEMNWNFNSRYYFTARNCTTEITRLLYGSGISLSQFVDVLDNPVVSPSGLFKLLLGSDFTYEQFKTRKDLQSNNLLFFVSSRKNAEAALSIVSQAANSKITSPEQYFKQINPDRFETLLAISHHQTKLPYALHYLEVMRSAHQARQNIEQALKKDSNTKSKLESQMNISAQVNHSYRFAGSFLDQSGYGIPSLEEAKLAQQRHAQQLYLDRSLTAEQARQLTDFLSSAMGKQEEQKLRLQRIQKVIRSNNSKQQGNK